MRPQTRGFEDRVVGDFVGDGPHSDLLMIEAVRACERLDVGNDEIAAVVVERRHADVELTQRRL